MYNRAAKFYYAAFALDASTRARAAARWLRGFAARQWRRTSQLQRQPAEVARKPRARAAGGVEEPGV